MAVDILNTKLDTEPEQKRVLKGLGLTSKCTAHSSLSQGPFLPCDAKRVELDIFGKQL